MTCSYRTASHAYAMRVLGDIPVHDLSLGAVVAATSGANAAFQETFTTQTPWMDLVGIRRFDNAKTSLICAVDVPTRHLLRSIEQRCQAELAARIKLEDDTWSSALQEDTWRININSQTALYGDDLAVGQLVAVVLEWVGVWMWNGRAGLQVKSLQVKSCS